MRALVLGGTGMLGRAVAAHGRRRGTPSLALSRRQADVTDADRLVYWADVFRPTVIVNCAAFTHVVAAAARVGAHLIHVSTDYVFEGHATTPYAVDHPTDPQSVYGRSKWHGEQQAAVYDRSLVLRTSWLFGPGGPNFVTTMRRLMLAGTPLKVVDDQVGGPTYTPYLARTIWDLADRATTGTLHYQNREPVSWYGFARAIADAVQPAAQIEPVQTDAFPRPAPRPAYSVLDTAALEATVGRRVEPWLAGLTHYLDTMSAPQAMTGSA